MSTRSDSPGGEPTDHLHRLAAGTYIIDGVIPDAATVRATCRPVLENYHDIYDRLVPLKADTRVLDLGCGLGHFLLYAKAQGVLSLYAMDVGERQVLLARDLGFQAERITDIPSALVRHRAAFDVIHLSHVIEHIPKADLKPSLGALRAALAPGGLLLVRTPNMSHWLASHMRYLDLTHETGFTAWSLRQALWQAGFRQIEITGSAPRFHARPKRIGWWVVNRLMACIYGLFLYLEMPHDRPTITTAEIVARAWR